MPRRLREILVPLTLEPDELEAREALGAPVRRPSASAVAWVLRGPGRGLGGPWSSWADRWGGEHAAKAEVARDGAGYVVDADAPAPRVVRTARLRADGLRSLVRVELLELVPEGTAIGYRLDTGSGELFWNGSAWAAPAGDATGWNTSAEINAHAATFPTSSRRLAIVARLSTTTAEASPAFYGARVVIGCTERGEDEDALFGGLRVHLAEELTASAVSEVTLQAAIGPLAPLELFPGASVDVATVDAAFDLTADPGQLVELSGTLTPAILGAPGTGARWAPASTIAAGRVVRLELSIRPDVVIQRDQDLAQLARIPAVRLFPSAVLEAVEVPEPEPLRGSTWEEGAYQPGGSQRISMAIDVVAIAETGGQARALGTALGDWLAPSGYRRLVSRETGRIVTIRAIGALVPNQASLAEGVTEIRGSWVLEFEARRGRTLRTVPILRAGGATLTVENPP